MTTTTRPTLTTPAPDRIAAAAELEILAACLCDDTMIRQLRGGHGAGGPALDWSQFGDKTARMIAKAMWELSDQRKPVTVSTVSAYLQAGAEPRLRAMIQRIDDAAVPRTIDTLPVNVTYVVEKANERLAEQILTQGLARLKSSPHEASSIAAEVQSQLANVRASRASLRDGSIGAIIRSGKHREVAQGLPIGLAAFDRDGGLKASEKLIASGLYGGRKTSLAVFLSSQIMRRRWRTDPDSGERVEVPPTRVLFLQKDDNRETAANWFISQVATQHIRMEDARRIAEERGLHPTAALELVPTHEWTISAGGMAIPARSAAQHRAILYAEAKLEEAPLEIRDGDDGVHDFATQVELILDAVMNRGVTVVIDDYVQASTIKGCRDVTETVNAYVQQMMPICTTLGSRYGMRLIALSQRPESVNSGGRAGDAAGLLGGGALARFASYIVETKGVPDDPSTLFLTKVKARFGQKGLKYQYRVNPHSGLILDPANVTPYVEPA